MEPKFEYQYIPYSATRRFSKTALDYLNEHDDLKPFYKYKTTLEGLKKAIEDRKSKPVDRKLLYQVLTKQYENVVINDAVKKNIELLLKENTFTICTAHQPNLFTGHLYFIYKIIHAIKLADTLNKEIPENHFVPVFFMGSEDADLEELNHIQLEEKKYVWQTSQTGAVGKMFIDKNLIQLINSITNRLLAEPYGEKICNLLKACFKEKDTIQNATFLFVHKLFEHYGLVIFLPDSPAMKNTMQEVFNDDLFNNTPGKIVRKTSAKLSKHYPAQAFARDINLFYMKGDIRNRIVQSGEQFEVNDTDIIFTRDQLKEKLKQNPEYFSPNVILRGLFQERVLPDIVYIGGGGELAYWLQLKDLFDHYKTPYPVLILRDSFTIFEQKWVGLIDKLEVTIEDTFLPYGELFTSIVEQNTKNNLSLSEEIKEVEKVYEKIRQKAANIDQTLTDHISALKAKNLKRLKIVEKKFLSAEKKKNEATGRQLSRLLEALFPDGGLQERTENFMLMYAKWDNALFEAVYQGAPVLSSSFCLIKEVTEKR